MTISAPTDIAGCKLWLQGNLGNFDTAVGGSEPANGGSVQRWEDQSGQGMHFTDATAPPTRLDAGVNGARSVRFTSGSSQRLRRAHASAAALNTLQDGSYTIVWAVQEHTIGDGTIPAWFAKYAGGSGRNLFVTGVAGGGSSSSDFGRYENTNPSYATVDNNGATSYAQASTPYIITYSFALSGANSGTETWRINGQVVAKRTGTVEGVNTADPWSIGCAGTTGSPVLFANMSMAMVLMYDTALSDADKADVEDYARSYLGLSAFASRIAETSIAFLGDSNTSGLGIAANLAYPAQVYTTIGRSYKSFNLGIAGATVPNGIESNIAAIASPDDDTRVAFVMFGTNQLGAETAAAVYAKLQTFYAALYSAGYDKVYALTVLRCGDFDAATETKRNSLNTLIVAGDGVDHDGAIEAAADAGLQNTSGAGFQADHVHLSSAGAAIVAGYVAPFVTLNLPPEAGGSTGANMRRLLRP
jgi:lysophospholipase L1-like esterase